MRSTVLSVLILLCLAAMPAVAQDLGANADTIALVITKTPSANAGQDTLELELWVYNDDLVKGANVGFTWDNPSFDMVNAEATPLVQNAFDLVVAFYEDGSLATTNANDRFLFGGSRLFNGMAGDTQRRHWATYQLVTSSWTVNDSIVLDTNQFNGASVYLFVNANTVGYQPVWQEGDSKIVIYDPDRPAASNLVVSPTTITVSAQANTGIQPTESFSVTSDGDPLALNITESISWLTVNPETGTTPQNFDVVIDVTGLAVGSYSEDIVVSSPDAANSPQSVTVDLTVTAPPPEIAVDQTSLSFRALENGSDPASQTINVTNSGGGSLEPQMTTTAPWLTISPTSGVAPLAVSVTANVAGLAPGTYSDSVVIADPDATNNPVVVPVLFEVLNQPQIVVNPTSFNLNAVAGNVLPTELLEITNGGDSTLSLVLTNTESWLTISPLSGTAPLNVSLDVSAVGLTAGTYNDVIVVTSPEAGNSPVNVPVELTVTENQPPVLNPVSDTTIDECDSLNISFIASDADGDDVDFWVDPLATNMTLTNMTGNMAQLQFRPNFDQAGTYVQSVYASDGIDTVSQEFTIIVEDCDPGFDAVAEVSPDPIYVFMNRTLDPLVGTVILGGITDGVHTVEDIDQSTLVLAGSAAPTEVNVLDSYEGFDGKVLEIKWLVRDFINPRIPVFDTNFVAFTVEGSYNDATPFSTADEILFRGKTGGDFNADGSLDLVDLTMTVEYLFGGGPGPVDPRVGDFDFSGSINLVDLARIVEYFYK